MLQLGFYLISIYLFIYSKYIFTSLLRICTTGNLKVKLVRSEAPMMLFLFLFLLLKQPNPNYNGLARECSEEPRRRRVSGHSFPCLFAKSPPFKPTRPSSVGLNPFGDQHRRPNSSSTLEAQILIKRRCFPCFGSPFTRAAPPLWRTFLSGCSAAEQINPHLVTFWLTSFQWSTAAARAEISITSCSLWSLEFDLI